MSAVSTPVIIAILILAVCLVVTSAVLAYRLRPDKHYPLVRRRPSPASSNASSPLRKMRLVNGLVEEEDTPQRPVRAFLPKWSNFHISRRTSMLSSKRHSTAAMYAAADDLEAQHREEYEKMPQIDVVERLSYEKSRRGRRSQRSSFYSPNPSRRNHSAHSSEGHESTEEIILPKSFPIPPSPHSFLVPPSPKPAILPLSETSRNSSTRRRPIGDSQKTESEGRPSTPPRLRPNISQTDAEQIGIISANISVPRATRTRSGPESPIAAPPPPIQLRHDAPTRQLPEITPSAEPFFIHLDIEERPSTRGRTGNLETIIEATTSPVLANEEEEKKKKKKQEEEEKKSQRRIEAAPRPPPKKPAVTPIVGKRRPPPIRTQAANNAAHIASKAYKTPRDNILTPDTEKAQSSAKSGGSITPPVMSSNITDVTSTYPFYTPPLPGKSRHSVATMTSSQYSPTFSLVTAHPMPLFSGAIPRPRPGSNDPPAVQLEVPSPAPTTPRQPAPVSKYKQATNSFRKSVIPPKATEKTALSSHPPDQEHDTTTGSESASSGRTDKNKRPSRYSHLMDKDKVLPPAPLNVPKPGSVLTTSSPGRGVSHRREPSASLSLSRPQATTATSSSSSSSNPNNEFSPLQTGKRISKPRSPETLEFQAALRSSAALALTLLPTQSTRPRSSSQSLSQSHRSPSGSTSLVNTSSNNNSGQENAADTTTFPQQQQQQQQGPRIPARRSSQSQSQSLPQAVRDSQQTSNITTTDPSGTITERETLPATYFLDAEDIGDDDDSEEQENKDNEAAAAANNNTSTQIIEVPGTASASNSALVSPITTTTTAAPSERGKSRASSRRRQQQGRSATGGASSGGGGVGISPLSETFPPELMVNLNNNNDNTSNNNTPASPLRLETGPGLGHEDLSGRGSLALDLDLGESFGGDWFG